MQTSTVSVDLAKTVFQVAVADVSHHVVARHRFTKTQFSRFLQTLPATEVVMEACATAHHWARVARGLGHTVTLLPPQYVRPYVRRGKTDRTDAEALLEARRSGSIEAVPVKSVTQQALVALHRVRMQWMRTRTARINAVRGLLREHGIDLPAGRRGVATVPALVDDMAAPLPSPLRRVLTLLHDEIGTLEEHLTTIGRELAGIAQDDPVIQRLMAIPGIGLITATALVATVTHIHGFRRARQFASWVGLTPREHSSGARRRLGGITKAGDAYVRTLLTHGARSVLLQAQRRRRGDQPLTPVSQWALTVASRAGHNKATVAVANKMARIVWAVWHRDVPYVTHPRPRQAA
jgi:transposase